MGDEVVEHHRRREDQPPGEVQLAPGRARAPAAARVAQRHAPRPLPEPPGIVRDGAGEVGPRLALEEVAHPPGEEAGLARDEDRGGLALPLGARRGAARAMLDPVGGAAQGQARARLERHPSGQPGEPGRDPAAVARREGLGARHRRPLRQGEHDLARGVGHAQRQATRGRAAAQGDAQHPPLVQDLDAVRIRAAQEEGSREHACHGRFHGREPIRDARRQPSRSGGPGADFQRDGAPAVSPRPPPPSRAGTRRCAARSRCGSASR